MRKAALVPMLQKIVNFSDLAALYEYVEDKMRLVISWYSAGMGVPRYAPLEEWKMQLCWRLYLHLYFSRFLLSGPGQGKVRDAAKESGG